jgi:starch-binding outer membrane protein, SusD/RagB family
MKKYLAIISSIFTLFFAIVLTGCEKQLEIEPRQSISSSSALTSKEAIEASIVSLYSRFKSARLYGRDLIAVGEALSDNGFATNKSGRLLPEAQNNQGATFTTTIWQSGYAGMNQLNLTLAAISKIPGATPADTSSWAGQLYFLRALTYFEMMKVYAYIPGAVVTAQDRGGVPIVLTGIENASSALALKPSRAPIDDVYRQIVRDLDWLALALELHPVQLTSQPLRLYFQEFIYTQRILLNQKGGLIQLLTWQVIEYLQQLIMFQIGEWTIILKHFFKFVLLQLLKA